MNSKGNQSSPIGRTCSLSPNQEAALTACQDHNNAYNSSSPCTSQR